MDEILLKLQDDMQKKGYIKKTQTMETMGRANFGRTLLVSRFLLLLSSQNDFIQKRYMQYPLQGNEKNIWIPINFCALGYNKPWVKWFLSPFCTDNSSRPPLNDQIPPAKPFCDPLGRKHRDTNCDRE